MKSCPVSQAQGTVLCKFLCKTDFPTLPLTMTVTYINTLTYLAMVCRYVSLFHRPRRPLGRVEVLLYSIFDLGTRRGWGVSVTHRPQLTPGNDPVLIVQEAGWASEPVWTGVENLAPTGIRTPDLPDCRQSLYRLGYSAELWVVSRTNDLAGWPNDTDLRLSFSRFSFRISNPLETSLSFNSCGIPLANTNTSNYPAPFQLTSVNYLLLMTIFSCHLSLHRAHKNTYII